jgi:hypothetical protein
MLFEQMIRLYDTGVLEEETAQDRPVWRVHPSGSIAELRLHRRRDPGAHRPSGASFRHHGGSVSVGGVSYRSCAHKRRRISGC